RAKFRYVMVDEYQDTNAAQFELVHALTQQHRNLCVVGDDDQSIYGWRGAEIANLLDMEKHFPEVKVIRLEQNYRSTNTILSAANAIIKHNVHRRPKQLWSQKGEGPKIALHAFRDDEEEARSIVAQIEGARLARRLSEPRMEALLAASHERKCSVFAVMKTPAVTATFPARPRQAIERFLEFIERNRAFLLPPSTPQQQGEGRGEASPIRNRPAPSFATLQHWAQHFLGEIGYFDDLRRTEKTPEAAESRIRNLQDLLASLDTDTDANAPSASPFDRLQTFLEEITLDTEREAEDDALGEAVTLITMHSCKGLEFPHVSIVGME